MDKKNLTRLIRQKAIDLGFTACGFAKSEFLEDQAKHLENWLKNGYHGSMSYMERNFDKRLDPGKLVENAKTVISFLYNYFPEKDLYTNADYKISKYAYGEDYHMVVKEKLNTVASFIQSEIGEFNFRCFVDSAPVLEKTWAHRAGLGWPAKNGNLISKGRGSFFFLAELICDLDLEYDIPVADHCGTCTKCIDACPTEAIVKPYVVDGSKCISYLTIELKDELIPSQFAGKMQGWIYGCDICQDVCPWNSFSVVHNEPAFKADRVFQEPDIKELTKENFNILFKNSPIKRTKYEGLMRNFRFVNSGLNSDKK